MTNYAAQLEQQFQARIAQAKEAARLASIAAAARGLNASNGPPLASTGRPSRTSAELQSSASFPIENVPFDVRNRIDRLVEFVARNGDAFEATARERERDNPDFAFLRPGGPFFDYYEWKKQQKCGPVAECAPSSSLGASSDSSRATAPPLRAATDPLGEMSVGAMANVCKYARASGLQVYVPISREVMMKAGNFPPVEPARLEIRLSEFYRHEERSR